MPMSCTQTLTHTKCYTLNTLRPPTHTSCISTFLFPVNGVECVSADVGTGRNVLFKIHELQWWKVAVVDPGVGCTPEPNFLYFNALFRKYWSNNISAPCCSGLAPIWESWILPLGRFSYCSGSQGVGRCSTRDKSNK